MQTIKLTNSTDLEKHLAGELPASAVRCVEIEGLVDTGATELAIPAEVVSTLGLRIGPSRSARLADGRIVELPRAHAIHLEILGRDMTCDAIVLPAGTTALIGQVQLETLDLIVDAPNQALLVNPRSPHMPMVDLLAL